MSESVLFSELTSENGKKIAIARLNSEKSLNALTLEMVNILAPQLQAWQSDEDVAMVMLEGAGEKAFCAGGDVVHLYKHTIEAGTGNYSKEVETFFTEEYKLDFMIHNYSKPILLWGHGIVMGGGLGLLAGASHRVVTEKSRIAMPEITIGLYPDVGGSYFLNKMPKGCGLFLGLTGASINAADAKHINLADYFVCADHKEELLKKLVATHWGDTVALNHQKLTDVLISIDAQDKVNMPAAQITNFSEFIASLDDYDRVESAVALILDHPTKDKWFNKAKMALADGSALTAHIVKRQLDLGKHLSLADCFRMELGLSMQCSANGELAEGIRALLIDKDNQPKWLFDTVHDVTEEKLSEMFTSPWSDTTHPLVMLDK